MNRAWTRFAALTSAVGLAGVGVLAACSDDSTGPKLPPNYGTSSSGGNPTDGGGGAEGGTAAQVARAEAAFRKIEGELTKTCGGAGGICHQNGTYPGNPAKFLAGPDAYKSIKAQPGVVVRDVFQSTLITKGGHAGPALGATPDLETGVQEWLNLEAIVLQGAKLPTTEPIAIVMGANTIDLSKAGTPEAAGTKLTFEAAVIPPGILALSKMQIVAPATGPVHLVHPFFFRVKANPSKTELAEVPDPADTFSNADQHFAAGSTEKLEPGTALFSSPDWKWVDGDKLRIEFSKLEKGIAPTDAGVLACANATQFGTAITPVLRTDGCTAGGCHGGPGMGGGLSLMGIAGANNNNADACREILLRVNKANFAQSTVVRKLNGGLTHSGGQKPATVTALMNNQAVF